MGTILHDVQEGHQWTHRELNQAQLQDPDVKHILQWMLKCTITPPWEEVAPYSDTCKLCGRAYVHMKESCTAFGRLQQGTKLPGNWLFLNRRYCTSSTALRQLDTWGLPRHWEEYVSDFIGYAAVKTSETGATGVTHVPPGKARPRGQECLWANTMLEHPWIDSQWTSWDHCH